jgi:ATP synthase protein I
MGAPQDRDARLGELEQRIRAARRVAEPERRGHAGEKYHAMSTAWRMVLELVLGVVVGTALGWGIDWLAGTMPAFSIVFGLLGFGAGVRVMMQSAEEVRRRAERERETAGDGKSEAP